MIKQLPWGLLQKTQTRKMPDLAVGGRSPITSVRSLEITIFGLYDRTALSSDRDSTFRMFCRHKSMISSNITSAILVRISRPRVENRFRVTKTR